MAITSFQHFTPSIDKSAFVAPDAWVIGQVTLGLNASMFFGAVARGDIYPITVGAGTNVQEHALLHTSHGIGPCTVGAHVTVGHRAIIHGATVKDRCIVGMGAIILDQAEVGEDCIIGANSLITMRTIIPAGSMVMGSPAKVVRQLTAKEIESIRVSAQDYVKVAAWYRDNLR